MDQPRPGCDQALAAGVRPLTGWSAEHRDQLQGRLREKVADLVSCISLFDRAVRDASSTSLAPSGTLGSPMDKLYRTQ
jgi:hypothetical protein